MPQPVSILFGAAWTLASAWALGRGVLRRLGLDLYRGEYHALGFVTGAALLHLALFVLGALGLYYDATFWLLGAACLGAGWWLGRGRPAGAPAPAAPRAWRWGFWLLWAPFAFVYLVNAMAPEMSPDGSTYHLGVMGRYYREHGLVRMPNHMYANLSQGVDLLYLMAYSIGRHSAAALVHCGFLLTLPALMLLWGRRFGHPAAAAAGALFTFLSPVVGLDGSTAYIDVACAAILFAVFYVVELWRAGRQPLLLPLAGLLAGYAFAAKYTAFLAGVYVFAAVVPALWRRRQAWLRSALLAAGCLLLMALPWLVKSWLWIGNPAAPLLNRWFENPYFHVSFDKEYSEAMRRYPGIESYAELPLELTVRGAKLGGLLGPLFLLSPLALLALRFPAGRRLLAAGLLFALPFALNIGTRFLIPALPFISIALALALAPLRWALPALLALHAVASWPYTLDRYTGEFAWRIHKIQWKGALRIETEHGYLDRLWPPYRLARMIEQHTLPGDVVFSFGQIAEAYTSREVRVGYMSAANARLRETLLHPLVWEIQRTNSYEFSFPRQQLDAVRLEQTATGEDIWSLYEVRLFNQGNELPREPGWRLRAQPFPWDVRLAFDNSPLTRWRGWQAIRPGQFVEIRFPAPRELDLLVAEMSTDQYQAKMRLFGQRGGGAWQALNEKPREQNLAPVLGLRHMATAELRRAGITHLFVDGGDFGAADFANQAELWGLTELAEIGGNRLYRIN
jgi:hypothetical protein